MIRQKLMKFASIQWMTNTMKETLPLNHPGKPIYTASIHFQKNIESLKRGRVAK